MRIRIFTHRRRFLRVLLAACCLSATGIGPVRAETAPACPEFAQARMLFYQSVEDARHIEEAVQLFEEIQRKYADHEGRALVYLGTLRALRGKHARWPYTKLKFVKQGLALMDQGIKKAPRDVEALFIRGATCHHLPRLFGRHKQSLSDLNKVIQLLDTQPHFHDAELVHNVVEFLLANIHLEDQALESLERIKGRTPVPVRPSVEPIEP